jgi:hypothetical protein
LAIVPLSHDPLRWVPLVRDVVAFAIAAGTSVVLWLRKRGARQWPMVYGKVEYASSFVDGAKWVTDISYSYGVAGEFYSGQFKVESRSERRADDVEARWKDQPVCVRYSPRETAISVVREEDQASLHPAEYVGH